MSIFYDGDYSSAQVAGAPKFLIPFATDPLDYVYQLTYWQDANLGNDPPAIGSPGPFGGFYVGMVPGSLKAIGGGIYEFEREFALVPNTRSEYESFVYQYHLGFFTFGVPNSCIQASPLTVQSRVQFDYFQTTDPSSIDLPRAPQILQTCLGNFVLGEFPTGETPSGTEVLAEDAFLKMWKPGIYERRMRFIKWINSAELLTGG